MTRLASYLSPQQMFLLDLACKPISEAFDGPPYLVGSVTERPDFRDVDVRLILDDEIYDHLVPSVQMRTMLSLAFTAYLQQVTGLPMDFGIQRRTEANAQHNKPRNPLGLRHLNDWTGDAPLEPSSRRDRLGRTCPGSTTNEGVRMTDMVLCDNCGRAIRPPRAGSYPPGVLWVHDLSPMGPGNRYCDFSGNIARPRVEPAAAEEAIA